ncbi:hypothetical protein [Protaetiibacter larvae]|uniref:WXG100 family type VII secretion target n=1 Tax=Protaetiibacter larvae TaxID=2592654 RepID=A0A5C1Y9S8_9MICO|nr:hypothetical protein [Protaetiibacter larvae]QEO10651.1 hypothetical protein FLP23_11930 [Protaetiibacter larvae]
MADLRVDYDRLGELHRNLELAVTAMSRETETSIDVAIAVGDARLGVAANSFRDSWDKHRLDIRDRLQWLRDSVGNIHDQLSGTDTELAKGLTAPPASGASNRPQAV